MKAAKISAALVCAALVIAAGGLRFYAEEPSSVQSPDCEDVAVSPSPLPIAVPEPEEEPEDEPEEEPENEPEDETEPIETTPAVSELPELGPLPDDGLMQSAAEVYYGVYYFGKDQYYSSENSAQTPSASVIKVFIMRFVYSLMETGLLSPEDTINGQSIHSLIRNMIQISDNAATNALIDEFGMDAMNQYFQDAGYLDTVLQRRMLDFAARGRGLDNYTSVDDVMSFLKTLYDNSEVYPYNEMLQIMIGQTIKTKIPSMLPENVIVANKTGELEDVENDIGIVFNEKCDFAIAVLTNHCFEAGQARQAIGHFAKQAYELLNAAGEP